MKNTLALKSSQWKVEGKEGKKMLFGRNDHISCSCTKLRIIFKHLIMKQMLLDTMEVVKVIIISN